jgi:hypothetical protein
MKRKDGNMRAFVPATEPSNEGELNTRRVMVFSCPLFLFIPHLVRYPFTRAARQTRRGLGDENEESHFFLTEQQQSELLLFHHLQLWCGSS